MMGQRTGGQKPLFYSFKLDEHIPTDHLLRGIDRCLDLSELRRHLIPFYSHTGRPSIDPELMVRMLIVGYSFGIRSERRLCEEVHLNLAYRWFCRLGLEDAVPDHSTFSKNRHGRFRESDAFRQVFESVVARCMKEGLVGGEGFAVDASLIVADANKQRSIPGPEWQTPDDRETASRAVKEYLATLDDAAFGAASEVRPKFISPSDPAAQWTGAMRGPAFFAYADNYLIDVKFGVIVDVEASRAIRQAEVDAAKTMIDRTEDRFGLKPARLAADTAYGSAATLNWIVNDKKIAPHIPVLDKSRRDDGKVNCCTQQAGSMMARRFSTVPEPPIVVLARSRLGAAPRHPSARSRAASTKALAMLPVHWSALKRSSNRVAIANASRCCSPTSSAFSNWVAFGFVVPVERRTSSRWPPLHRTCAGSPSWSSGHRRQSIAVLPRQSGCH
jgi:transposase